MIVFGMQGLVVLFSLRQMNYLTNARHGEIDLIYYFCVCICAHQAFCPFLLYIVHWQNQYHLQVKISLLCHSKCIFEACTLQKHGNL